MSRCVFMAVPFWTQPDVKVRVYGRPILDTTGRSRCVFLTGGGSSVCCLSKFSDLWNARATAGQKSLSRDLNMLFPAGDTSTTGAKYRGGHVNRIADQIAPKNITLSRYSISIWSSFVKPLIKPTNCLTNSASCDFSHRRSLANVWEGHKIANNSTSFNSID